MLLYFLSQISGENIPGLGSATWSLNSLGQEYSVLYRRSMLVIIYVVKDQKYLTLRQCLQRRLHLSSGMRLII